MPKVTSGITGMSKNLDGDPLLRCLNESLGTACFIILN